MKRLAHHRPVSDKCTLLGHKDHHEEIEITIVLRRKLDHDPLPTTEDYANGYVPISREEFIVKYGSSPDDALAVANHYRSIGFTHIDTHHGRRHVYLRGTVRQINLAFNTTMGNFEKHHCNQMMYFHAPTTPLHVPDHLHDLIMGTHGFDLEPLAIPHSVPANTVELTPAQVMAVYNWPTNLATGQTIAVMMQNSFGPINQSDINATCARYGVPSISVPVISVDGSTLGDGTEAITDIGVLATYAQGANLVAYIGAEINSAISRVAFPQAGEATCHIATFSGGFIEDVVGLDTLHIFEDCAVLGITLICSVGDWGSTLDFTDVGTNQVQAEFPGTHPFWTAVGGTTLGNISTPISANSTYQEWYWDETSISQTVGHGNMGGGGVSRVYAKPGFQKNITVPQTLSTIAPLYNGQGRGFPDIAANSAFKSGLEIFANGGTLLDFYGTSVAAPIMAALFARINAALGHPVGYLNPTLYKIGTGTNIIRDINANDAGSPSTNANFAGHGAPGYPVNVGWDACTGLGRIDGKNLLAYYQARDTTLGPVTNISVISTNLPAGTITVGWVPPVSNLGITYNVQLSTDGAAYTFLGYTTDTFFIGTGLSPGHTYSFGVVPISENLQGTGVGSSLFQLVAPVTAIHVVSFDSTSITIGWTAPSVGTGFNYKVSIQTGGGFFQSIGNPTTTTFAATGLTPSTSYVFLVTADIAGSDSTAVSGGPFSTAAATAPPPTESPDGMFVADPTDMPAQNPPFFAANPGLLVGPITGIDNSKWTLRVSATPYQVAANGVIDPQAQETILLVYSGHRIYKQSKDSTWQSKSIPSDTWVTASDPRFGAIVPNHAPQGSGTPFSTSGQCVVSQHSSIVLNEMSPWMLFWGDEWASIATTFTDVQHLLSSINGMLSAGFWKGLQEYRLFTLPSNAISRTVSGNSSTLSIDPATFLKQFLDNLIVTNGNNIDVLPSSTVVWLIMFPPSIPAPTGLVSFSDSFVYRGVPVNYAAIYTSLVPNQNSPSNTADQIRPRIGRELINSASDPRWPITWPIGVVTASQTTPGAGIVKGTWYGQDIDTSDIRITTQALGRIEDHGNLLPVGPTGTQLVYSYYSNKLRTMNYIDSSVTIPSFPAGVPAEQQFIRFPSFNLFTIQGTSGNTATIFASPPTNALPTDTLTITLDYKRACDVTWTNFTSNLSMLASALTSTPLVYTGLAINTIYMFRGSVNGGRYCLPVMGITTTTLSPNPVTNVIMTNNSNTTETLVWTAPANLTGAVTYRILSSTTSGLSGFTLISSGLTAATFTATGLSPNTQYWYQIIPTVNGADGPTTTAGPFFTTNVGAAPGPVTNIISAGNTSNTISISWTAPAGVTTVGLSYTILAGTTGLSGPFNLGGASNVTATNFTMTGTTPNTDYYFQVTPSLNGVAGTRATGGPFRFTTTVGTSFNQLFSIIALAESPDGMMVVDDPVPFPLQGIAPLFDPIVGSDGTRWALSYSSVNPYQVTANGVIDPTTNSVITLIYHNQRIYQRDKFGNWFWKKVVTDTWTFVSDPRPGIIFPNYPTTFTVTENPSVPCVVTPHVDVYTVNSELTLVFWGSIWNTITSPYSASDIVADTTVLLNSPYMSGLQEYGLFAKPVLKNTVFTSVPFPSDILTAPDGTIAAITTMLDSGTLQLPTSDEHQFVFVLPAIGNPVNTGGYADSFIYKNSAIHFSLNFNFGTRDSMMEIITHEFTESLIDRYHLIFLPFLKQGAGDYLQGNWHGHVETQAGQIEDVANHAPTTVFGIGVQGFYSNKANAVIIPTAETPFPAGLPAPRVYTTAPCLSIFLNAITSTTAFIAWNIPDGFTFGTTYNYTIEYRRLCDVSWIIQSFTAANNSFTITGLQPYTAYIVRMTFQGGRPCVFYVYAQTPR